MQDTQHLTEPNWRELGLPELNRLERLWISVGEKFVFEHPLIAMYGQLVARPKFLFYYLSHPRRHRLLRQWVLLVADAAKDGRLDDLMKEFQDRWVES